MAELVKVLLVDDQVRNLEALQAVLHPSGCRLITAQSADEALLALLQHDFAAIVLDIRMPGMDGYELARRIRLEPWGADVVLVALSGWSQEDHRDRAGRAGFDLFLTKPLDPAGLQQALALRTNAR
jgi:CheY-like chemotaxis protein